MLLLGLAIALAFQPCKGALLLRVERRKDFQPFGSRQRWLGQRLMCSAHSTRRGPRAGSMSLLTQALTLGLATASTSAFGRLSRTVRMLDVTQSKYRIRRMIVNRLGALRLRLELSVKGRCC